MLAPQTAAGRTRPLDTTEEAWREQVRILRAMAPERRLQVGFELTRMANRLCEEGIRMRHPKYDEREVFLARARLMLGDVLFRAAYQDQPCLTP